MAIIVGQESELLMLQYITGAVSAGNKILRLYTNSVTLNDSFVYANFTHASVAGYAPITLVASLWTVSASGGVSTALYSAQTFAITTGISAVGYFVTEGTSKVVWAEEFVGGPLDTGTTGGNIVVVPRLTCE